MHSRKEHASSFAHPGRNVSMLGIEPGMKVADFGAGSGAYAFLIAEALHASGHVYAIDVQNDLLRRIANEAKRRGLINVETIWGDLETWHGSHIADAALDLVLISNLLFQVEDKKAVMREAWRVVRKNGRLAIIDWTDSFNNMGPHSNDVVQKNDVLALARDAHFSFVKEFGAGAHHYGLLFRKHAEKGGTM
jgi:ubiquinone/menaquinone biosynthesis C-methylase UbiE